MMKIWCIKNLPNVWAVGWTNSTTIVRGMQREREDEDILVIKKLSFMWDMTFFSTKKTKHLID
jgi:hypothetical protein